MVDVNVETPEALELLIGFLAGHVALKRAMLTGAGLPATPTPPAPPAPVAAPAAPVAPAAPAAPSNVLPFTPPAPTMSAPAAAIPGTPAPASPSSAAPVSPGASVAPPAPSAPAVDEFDDHGVPYDGRIHQKGKSKKKDGSWKLQKGIAETLVSQVMQELAPRIRRAPAAPTAPAAPPAPDAPPAGFGTTPLPAGAAAPVSLPPLPAVPGQAQAPVAPPAPPAETVAPEADPFRALVKKVTEARGAKRITAEEVTQCAAAAGVPGLQALNAMPHLIATVEANIDALLATR